MIELPEVPQVHDYWTPPKAVFGDSDSAPLFQSVGQSLTAWERLEFSLATLFSLLCEDKSKTAAVLYGNLGNNRAKTDAFKMVVEPAFGRRKVLSTERACLSLLLRHFEAAAPRRNDIAHGIVMSFTLNSTPMGPLLVPPWYSHKKTREKVDVKVLMSDDLESMVGRYSYRYTSADIDVFTTKFMNVRQWVNSYIHYYNDKYLRPEMIADAMRRLAESRK